MVDQAEDDVDFDSMLDDCAQGLDTKIAHPSPSQQSNNTTTNSLEQTIQSEIEPMPLPTAPQMHLQDAATPKDQQAVAEVEATTEPATQEEDKLGDDINVEDIRKNLQEVLKDDDAAEECIKGVDQMMAMLQQQMQQQQMQTSAAATQSATKPQQQSKPQGGGGTFLQQMMQNQAKASQEKAASNNADPFGASASAMFNDFEKAKTEASSQGGDARAGPETAGQLPPGVGEGDMENLEKQFMGMFQNITKQMENMDLEGDDGDSDDDENLTEEEKKEADAMLKNLFGAMGVDPSAGGAGGGAMPDLSAMMGGMGMPGMGMPGMGNQPGGAQPPNQQEFEAQMNQFEQMFKSMGMHMDGNQEKP